MITILGPTASGKTSLAVGIARLIGGEIISADSRQVYREMNIGTGKDIAEYSNGDEQIPYHLIDIADPGEEYNVYRYQTDFLEAYAKITASEKIPVLCGGTGMYIESVLKGYRLIKVPDNYPLRERLKKENMQQLEERLRSYRKPHNSSDLTDRSRLIRAIEIQEYYEKNPDVSTDFPKIRTVIFGIAHERNVLRERITSRLYERLDQGMIEEVEKLNKKIGPDKVQFYGLEYKLISQYIEGKLEYDEMVRLLNTAIAQFAKRQSTWFRKMEKEGVKIHWIDGNLDQAKKMEMVFGIINTQRWMHA